MRLIPSRTPISEVGSEGEAGVQLMTSMPVSEPRCLLKGVSGHAPRPAFVALAGDDGIVSFCKCNWSGTAEASRGIERVKQVAINANSGRLCKIILGAR